MIPAPEFIEGEKAILGGLLIDNSQAFSVFEELATEDFYKESHRHIFQALAALHGREMPLDFVTLTQELKQAGKLEAVGGPTYVVELADAVPSAANINHFVCQVKEKAALRRIIATASEIMTRCHNGSDFETILQETEELALAAASMKVGQKQGRSSDFKSFSRVMSSCIDAAEEAMSRRTLPGLTSGFREIDNQTTGFHPGELWVICGRPGMGKTALAWACTRAVAGQGIPVGFNEIEMAEKQMGQRALAREAALNLRSLRMGDFGQDTIDKLVKAAGDLSDLPVDLYTPSTLSPTQIRFRARSLAIRHQFIYGLVIADHLGLMNPGRRIDSREQQISTISREMKQLAKDLNCPVILLAQLNRKLEDRPDKRPRLSDLRESGAIEQDADGVIGLYQPFPYTGNDEDRGKAEAIILKQRNGPVGTVELEWTPATASYWSKSRGSYPNAEQF